MNKDNYHEQGNIIIIPLLLPLGHISNKLSLLLGYEEMKRITKHIPEYNLEKFLDIDLEEFLCIVR